MTHRMWRTAKSVLAAIALVMIPAGPAFAQPSETAVADADSLQPVSAFENIENETERSLALFEEVGKVLTHPRCVNCHPAGDVPLQGEEMTLHVPPVQRGDGGMGVAGMRCFTCHGEANFDPAGVPGHPVWHLAPASMAWEGKSLGQICEQIKDPERNGGKSLAELETHMREDGLVGWGWEPGAGREPAPGSWAAFGELVTAWIETGAACPAA